MSFSKMVKNRELAYITRLLAVFGAVEERQMRELFNFMNDRKYGAIIHRISSEGTAYRTDDAHLIASSKFTLEKSLVKECVMCFWAFIKVKNKVLDFFPGAEPAIVTLSTKMGIYDLLPVTDRTIEQINDAVEVIPESTVRFLITEDLHKITRITRRSHNDFVLLVDDDGVAESYEL